jgi:glycosyltransferase involved in cell wall biosynthesis
MWLPNGDRGFEGLAIKRVGPFCRQEQSYDCLTVRTPSHMIDRIRLLVVIPAHNEGESLGSVIAQVRTHVPSADILVIDDGSIDITGTVAREAGALVISLPQNLGIGAATQTGYIFAHEMGYDVVARVDADGQHDPAEIPRLTLALSEEGVHAVIGSRFIEGGSHATSFVRRLGIWLLANLISLITRQEVTDPTSGFQVVDNEALALCARHFPHDYPEPESRVLLHRAGLKIKEIPVSSGPRLGGRSSISAFDSIQYMVRVIIALLVDLLRAVPQGRKPDGEG